MQKYKIGSIVVGIDFSDYSRIVVKEAKELSKKFKLPLVFVYVYEDINLYRTKKTDQTKITHSLENKIRTDYALNNKEKVVVRLGLADKEILAIAKNEKNPMLVIGHKGSHAIARFFIGSVAEKLAATSPYPVWIHRGEKIVLPKRILTPSDLSKKSEKTMIKLDALNKTFGSRIEIYHIFLEPFPILDYESWGAIYADMKEEEKSKVTTFKKKFSNLKTTIGYKPIAECVLDRAKKFDLIALSAHGSSKSQTAFGSVATKIVRAGNKPVLIIP